MPAIYKNGLLYAGTSGGSGANTDIIADEYTEKAYAVGDYCIHEDALYKCNTAITVAESWTAAHWTEKDIATELKAINNTISTLGTASTKNVPSSGNAGTTEVVLGNDTRLTDARPASDTTSTYSSTGTVPVNGTAVASAISGKMNTSNPSGTGSFSMNRKANTTVGNYSTAEGYNCTASGSYSHAEGESTTAAGRYGSHAEGLGVEASGDSSHAEGGSTTASGECSHAEGGSTTAGARYSHAEGNSTTANAEDAHAEGLGCTASGLVSHAEGGYTTSSGSYSHVEGYYTTAQRKSQHVFGEYNVLDTTGDTTTKGDYVEIVGNGTGTNARSNARTLDWSGNEWIAGNYKSDALTASKLLVSDANKNITSSSLAESDLITTSNIGSQSVNYATSAGSADNATKWNNIVYDMATANTTDTWIPVLSNGKFQHRVLAVSAGSATQPIYMVNGNVAACTYTLGKSVPSNAVFTDTNTWRPVQNNLKSTSTTDCLSAAQGKALNDGKIGTYAQSGTFNKVNHILEFISSNTYLGSTTKGNYTWGVSAWSDNRLKDNIKDSQVNALDKINKIKMREFDFVDEKYGEHQDIGYVAQELKEVAPECVVDVPISEEEQAIYNSETLMQVEDKHLIKYLVKAIQELSQENINQQKEINELKGGDHA